MQVIKPYLGETHNHQKAASLRAACSFKVGQHGQQQLNLQCKVCWILLKMVGLLAHRTTHTISIKNWFLHFSQLLPPYFTSFLLPKTILTISTNTPSLYNSATFRLPIFTCSHLYNLLWSIFLCLNHLANLDCISDQLTKDCCEEWHCFNLFLLLCIVGMDNCTNNYWFLIGQAQKIGIF